MVGRKVNEALEASKVCIYKIHLQVSYSNRVSKLSAQVDQDARHDFYHLP